jgi:Glycosyl transferase family 2
VTANAPSIGFVVPVLDERDHLPRLLDGLDLAADELGPSELAVAIADNGSRDGSWELLTAAAEDRPYLRVVRTSRPGPGRARSAAARVLAEGWRDRDPAACWVVSCDADNVVDADHVSAWADEIRRRSTPALLTGSYEFEGDALRSRPGGPRLADAWGRAVAWSERCVGVVNPTGANHAVRLHALEHVGWYRQPTSAVLGPEVVVAGDDWDLGIRIRLAQLGAGRVPIIVRTSPRRFLIDPVAYLTGAAHDGPFRRVDAAVAEGDELPAVAHAVATRAVLHFLVKPVLLGLEVNWLVLAATAGDELTWALRRLHASGLESWKRSRDEFVYGVLPAQASLAGALASRAGNGS